MKKMLALVLCAGVCFALGGCSNAKSDFIGYWVSDDGKHALDLKSSGESRLKLYSFVEEGAFTAHDDKISVDGQEFTVSDHTTDSITIEFTNKSVTLKKSNEEDANKALSERPEPTESKYSSSPDETDDDENVLAEFIDEKRLLGYWQFYESGSRFFLCFDDEFGMKMKGVGVEWQEGSYYADPDLEMVVLDIASLKLKTSVGYYFTDDDHVVIGEWECERVTESDIK